jgi:spoIIIJ-associated protein
MSEFKTFTGKSVDDAMEEACRHFDAKREKLEIEILDGGSTGIFGLVGKKKAKIKARLREEVQLLGEPADAPAPKGNGKPQAPAVETPAAEAPDADVTAGSAEAQKDAPGRKAGESERKRSGRDNSRRDRRPQKERRPEAASAEKREAAPEAPRPEAVSEADAAKPAPEAKPPRQPKKRREDQGPPPEIPQELRDIVVEVMERMLTGILGQATPVSIEGHPERVTVIIDDEDNSGLLIGREGQTLSSLQYLVNRIVARRWESPVRVQINTGDYREKQDENLRKMAIYLADKAKDLGRPQSTKPLSSYHRRVVHMVLQEDDSIQTRSKGDGPLKRVLIMPRPAKGDNQAPRS